MEEEEEEEEQDQNQHKFGQSSALETEETGWSKGRKDEEKVLRDIFF